jgi:Transposase and inactivated derivatives
MSQQYKFRNANAIYFSTSTVVGWIDVFTRDIYRNILLDSIRFSQQNKGMQIHGWVLMTNHLHLIFSCTEPHKPAAVLKEIKSYTAMKIIDAIVNHPQESRKHWMLNEFEKYGEQNRSTHRFQFWQHRKSPIQLENAAMYVSRLNYVHSNPVKAGFVAEPQEWLYSSAADYCRSRQQGPLSISFLNE